MTETCLGCRPDLAGPRCPAVPLVVAAHGTRDPQGQEQCRALVRRVARLLPGVDVSDGYVELVDPPIADALAAALRRREAAGEEARAAVVPLMLGTGSHVQQDIPEAIAAGTARVAGSHASYARYLGHDPRLLDVLVARLAEACGPDWEPAQVAVVLVGRGTSMPRPNADHAALARLVQEAAGARWGTPAYIQVTQPDLPAALDQAAALGASRVVVVPNFLFAGQLRTWTREQAVSWAAGRPGVEVRVAEVIGDVDELAAVVADRYREVACAPADGGCGGDGVDAHGGSPVYLAGLRLSGRRVLVVGGGHIAERRVPRLLEAGARVRLVAPSITPRLSRLIEGGAEIDWRPSEFAAADVAGCWYVLACTDSPEANAAVFAAAEQAHTFCVRADRARKGSAWTPALASADGLTVAVIGDRNPRRSAQVRDALMRALHDE